MNGPQTDGNARRLLFVTGTRADYGKLEPLAQAARLDGFHIAFFITGMHMMKRYGETRFEVKRFQHADFFEFVNQREGDAPDFVLAKTILGFSDFLHEHSPDLVVIHGDRIEAMAAGIVCAMHNIRSAHIEGGEVSGTMDESIRHCNTKLCTTHFVSCDDAERRVLALGEARTRVFNIGSPELDIHAQPSGVTLDEVRARYDIHFPEYGIAIFHPVTSEPDTIGAQAQALFDALQASGRCFVVIAPNNDPGTDRIFSVLEQLPKDCFRVIPSMRFRYFSELMKHAGIMAGNSSAGVREFPFLGKPSINIGTRQQNRSHAPSILHCEAQDRDGILAGIRHNWNRQFPRELAFGDGNSVRKFVGIVKQDTFWSIPLQKVFAPADE